MNCDWRRGNNAVWDDGGKYDLMGGMFYQKEYESFLKYPKYAVGSSYCLLISRENDPEVKSFDISTLNGKTIGVFQNAKSKSNA